MSGAISILDHADAQTAEDIYALCQQAYTVEAALIGAKIFPPLQRSAQEIQLARSTFWGFARGHTLLGAVEFTMTGDHLAIDSLVVHPDNFRQGLASRLLQALLQQTDFQTADVETAAANEPAIQLYGRFGFMVAEHFIASADIEKVRLVRSQVRCSRT